MVRYRIGDLVRITSLRNENLGIELPQMAFERRIDDLIDFNVIRLTEKVIWQALEESEIAYVDWMAYKEPGEQRLTLLLELEETNRVSEMDIASVIYDKVINPDNDEFTISPVHDDLMDMVGFSIDVNLLPKGTFASYTAQKQAEGADLAHLKPPHINPSEEEISLLTAETEEIVVVRKTAAKVETIDITEDKKVSV